MLYVCGLHDMPHHVRTLRPDYLVSIVQSEFQPDRPPEVRGNRHLRLAIHDVSQHSEGIVAPDVEHVQELIAFLRRRADGERVLMHCYAGVSRSMAAALIGLALDAEGRELEAARALRAAAPHALPNARIVALADELLGRQGRLVAARVAMGPAALTIESPLVELLPLGPTRS